MVVKAALFFEKQRNRAVSALRASGKVLRSRGLMVAVGLTLSGAAFAQYFRFELVNTAYHKGTPDLHILVGELSATGTTLDNPSFNPPTVFQDSANWSSNYAAGQGGIHNPPGSTNYYITRIGGDSSVNSGVFTGTLGIYYISALTMGWTDASGASFIITGTSDGTAAGSHWSLYNATWNGSSYTRVGDAITAPGGGSFQFVWQGADSITGPLQGPGIESGYGPNTLPEIDASSLPKAALLVLSLYLLARSRKHA
jgi:hypothetical protein